jgi:hypothetical protein
MKRLALIPLFLAAVAAPPATAQQDGVFVDPKSPAGKEYAVPLDQARGEASGGEGSASAKEALFGAGIEPADGGPAASRNGDRAGQPGTASRKGEGDSREGGGQARERDGTPNPAGLGQSSAAIEAAAADGSNGLLSAGIAGAVLAGGLLAGFGLRRLLRSG